MKSTWSVAPAVADVLRSPGEPLADRGRWQAMLGQDFSSVRVHADPTATASARSVGAAAYTVGDHVAFAAGRYRPRPLDGQWLIAHELAHVVQQRRGGPPPPANADAASELAAHAVADAAVRGGGPITVPGATGVGLARQTDPRHARGYAGEQGMGFMYSQAEGWVFFEGPSGAAGHGVTTSGFDGVAYNLKTGELHLIDNKSLKATGNVSSATAIDPARNLPKNVDALIQRVQGAKDVPGRVRIVAKLRQVRTALASGAPLPGDVKLVVTTVGGRSTGVSQPLQQRGVQAHPSTPATVTPSKPFDEHAAIESSKAVQAYRAKKAAAAASAQQPATTPHAAPSGSTPAATPTTKTTTPPATSAAPHVATQTTPHATATPHVAAPATPHVATPATPHVTATPHVAAPATPHVATPATPHVTTPVVPHGGGDHGVGAAAAEAAAAAVVTIAAIIIQAKWVDPQNEEWLRNDLTARQGEIDTQLAALRPKIAELRAAGRPAYANVTVPVDYQDDRETGLTWYAGIVNAVTVTVSDQNISTMEYKRQGFFESLGNQLVGRTHTILKVSYPIQ